MLRYLLLSGLTIFVVGHGWTAAYGQSAPTVEDTKNEIDQAKARNRDPFAIAEQKNFGVTAGDWIILPEINVATFYDDNLFSSKTNPKGSWGFDVQPGLTFKRVTGMHNTTLSLTGDIATPLAVSGADTVVGAADLKHVYQIDRGFSLTYQGEVAHRYDQESAVSATGTGGGATGVYVEPISYMTYASSLVIDKSFNNAFVSAGGNILAFEYNTARTTAGQTLSESDRDLIEYSAHARAGLRVLSDLYVFVEPNITHYDFQQGVPATGYTLSGGVGSDHLSLFRGEIFGGYQIMDFGSGASSSSQLSGGTFGARVAWTPTPDLVATLQASQALTPSTVITGSVGSINKSDSVSAALTFGYTMRITFDAHASFTDLNYSVGSRDDKISQIGMSGTYYLTDRVGVRLQYDFTNVNSNQPIYDYERNRVILGIHIRL
jgi:hypothetical protein